MRTVSRRLVLVATFALTLVGCDSTPTEPRFNTPPNPTPQPPTAVSWTLTIEVTGDSPSQPYCSAYNMKVGFAFHPHLAVQRDAGTVSFVMADGFDWPSYTAALNGLNFNAVSPAYTSTFHCAYQQTNTLSGSFSADGGQLSAIEVWSIVYDSGERETLSFRWSGIGH